MFLHAHTHTHIYKLAVSLSSDKETQKYKAMWKFSEAGGRKLKYSAEFIHITHVITEEWLDVAEGGQGTQPNGILLLLLFC